MTGLALAAAADPTDRLRVAALVRATLPDVWRLCAVLADRDRADDLTQEVYVRVLKGIGGFRGETGVKPWLYAVVRAVVSDDGRRLTRRSRLQQRIARPGAPLTVPDPAEEVAGRDLLGRLSADRRMAFVLTQQLGFSYTEAAAALEVPVGTIRSRVARARMDLVSGLDGGEAAASL